MSGEGRGHATRVRAIVEDLRARHQVVLFAPGQAHSLLAPLYAGSDVEVRRIEGLSFRYTKDGRLDYPASVGGATDLVVRIPVLVGVLRRTLREESPDLVITDFEPLLPRAAESEAVPYISIDHQHFLTEFTTRDLPLGARLRAFLMGMAVRSFHGRQRLTVVSSFYHPRSKFGFGRKPVRKVGVLLGKDIVSNHPVDDGFLLVYLRRQTPERVFDALASCGLPVRIYGAERPGIAAANMSFHRIDRGTFVEDLARCRALVSTAGNQVVGEAIHLRKPVLALPETGNWEQEINGFWVAKMGIGMCRDPKRLLDSDIAGFLAGLDGFRHNMERAPAAGNEDVSRIVEEVLEGIARRKAGSRSTWFETLPSLLLGKAA